MSASTESPSSKASTSPAGPVTPSLRQMFGNLLRGQTESIAARTVEIFGWIDLSLGLMIFFGPHFMASLLNLPPLTIQGANYTRLVGLLVSGLGTLYVVSGRLNARGFIFASMLDRPAVPIVMAILWYLGIAPGPLALAFSISDFGGFLWTLSAWRSEVRYGQANAPGLVGHFAARAFGFVSGVVRNSRTFHPDGRVFRGTVSSTDCGDPVLLAAAERLANSTVLMRMGMGVMKRGMPAWLANRIPDAPSIAARFFDPQDEGDVRIQRMPGQDLDLLCTAGGDRLWKLLLNLTLGGKMNGLNSFDYFQNRYFADTPYQIAPDAAVWIRLVADHSWLAKSQQNGPTDGAARELGLTKAVEDHAVLHIEVQRVGDSTNPFIPIAEIRFEEEIQVDQEALHFDPVAGRGFRPYGFLTKLRRSVYPASVHSRPPSVSERSRRESESFFSRLSRYLHQSPSVPLVNDAWTISEGIASGGENVMNATSSEYSGAKRSWLRKVSYVLAAVAAISIVYLGWRFNRDKPVEYTDNILHFKHGSTGGERTMGIPYWFWVALPEIFPESLPGKQAGQGYSSFGMVYEKGVDPRYGLPDGMSMRNFRGIDVVYLNCAVCHTGTFRKAPGDEPTIVAGMPANTFDIGAFEGFLTSIALSQKFTGQRLMDQIDRMQDDPNKVVERPDFINRLILKYYAAPLMREKMLFLRERLGFIDAKTWGPGRVDTFNAPKALLNFNMSHADHAELVGNADFPSIWNQGYRKYMGLHWDGNNNDVNERNLSAAFGTGAYPTSLDADLVTKTANWLLTATPPNYPYEIDQALAQSGAAVYQDHCVMCHGNRDGPYRHEPPQSHEYVGMVDPIDHIKTDPFRLNSYTYLVAANQGTLYAGFEKDWGFDKPYPQRFSHFKKTNGYANVPLDGIWLRAPYLHNGSVPNLRELLEPREGRSKTFYRGNDVYDRENLGFVADIAEQNGEKFYLIDTGEDGNGNMGHEGHDYGTDMLPDKKRALLEYLKTF